MNSPDRPFKVLIAGGGVAALEALMALRALAGARVEITLLSPATTFHYRPLAVLEPFGSAPAHQYSIREIADAHDASVIEDSLGWVDTSRKVVGTGSASEIPYDALLLALGARAYPAFEQVATLDASTLGETFHGVIQDIEEGYSHSIAFVAAPGAAWPLPLYELALLTAHRGYDSSATVELSLITPEEAPLAIFGREASNAVSDILASAGILLHTSADVHVRAGTITMHPGARPVHPDRIIALPRLVGPAVRGLSAASGGFIPVTEYAQVKGVSDVFAAGDATDFVVKHGGVAAQQADVAATSIASLAGVDVVAQRFRPVIRGKLLTADGPRYLTARITGGAGFSSTFSDECPWSPPTKIAAQFLGQYLEERDALLGVS
ncbi:MAG: hypothetical protein NVSMB51_06150 [Solirubrobacteraceae bacterium]